MTKRRVQEAELSLEQTREDASDLERSIALDVRQAYLNLRRAERAVEISNTQVRNAELSLQVIQGRFEQELSILLELLDAQTGFAQALTNQVRAFYDYKNRTSRFAAGNGSYPMNRKRAVVLIISVLIVALVAVVAFGATKIFGKKDKDGEGDKKEVVRRGEFIVKVRESGNLEPLISVDVQSNVEGEIETLYIKEGDVVEKEQALLKIDHEQVLEQKKQAEANRDARRAQLEQAKLRIDMTEKQQASQITQDRNAVEVAKAALESLEANTRQRITEAETQISTTQNELQQDKISLRQSEIGREQASITLERARAAEESARVAFETAESELKRNQGLFEKKLVSKRVLEEAETARANALSQHETAKKDVESQIKAVESEQETIDARKKALGKPSDNP